MKILLCLLFLPFSCGPQTYWCNFNCQVTPERGIVIGSSVFPLARGVTHIIKEKEMYYELNYDADAYLDFRNIVTGEELPIQGKGLFDESGGYVIVSGNWNSSDHSWDTVVGRLHEQPRPVDCVFVDAGHIIIENSGGAYRLSGSALVPHESQGRVTTCVDFRL